MKTDFPFRPNWINQNILINESLINGLTVNFARQSGVNGLYIGWQWKCFIELSICRRHVASRNAAGAEGALMVLSQPPVRWLSAVRCESTDYGQLRTYYFTLCYLNGVSECDVIDLQFDK